MDVCVAISDLTGELQCDLVVMLSTSPGIFAGMLPTAIQMCNYDSYRFKCILLSDEGLDYTVTPPGVYEATFPSTTTMNGDVACDTITIIDDNVLEGLQFFGFQIISSSLPGITLFDGLAMVFIEDDESKC